MLDDKSARPSNPFGLAYNRLLADGVPGVTVVAVLWYYRPEWFARLPAEGAIATTSVVALGLMALATGLAVNFLGFTLLWGRVRWFERRIDMGRRARELFGIDAFRSERKLKGDDEWWAFVDRCEDFVLTRHPAWFEPYAHVDGMRKMVRGLALIVGLLPFLMVPSALPVPGYTDLAILGAKVLMCYGIAGGLLAYAGWMNGYYHAAIVQSVVLNSRLDRSGDLEILLSFGKQHVNDGAPPAATQATAEAGSGELAVKAPETGIRR